MDILPKSTGYYPWYASLCSRLIQAIGNWPSREPVTRTILNPERDGVTVLYIYLFLIFRSDFLFFAPKRAEAEDLNKKLKNLMICCRVKWSQAVSIAECIWGDSWKSYPTICWKTFSRKGPSVLWNWKVSFTWQFHRLEVSTVEFLREFLRESHSLRVNPKRRSDRVLPDQRFVDKSSPWICAQESGAQIIQSLSGWTLCAATFGEADGRKSSVESDAPEAERKKRIKIILKQPHKLQA